MTEQNEGMHLVTRANQKVELTAQGWKKIGIFSGKFRRNEL